MITMDVAPRVHRVSRAGTNLYVVEDGDAVTLVDAGLPAMWRETTQALRRAGRDWQHVAGIVLTHGHFDHTGLLARAVSEYGTPVWVHPSDRHIVRHPYRYRPGRPRLLYPLRHPHALPHLAGMVGAGALRVRGVEAVRTYEDGDVLDLPGNPVVVGTPGHTDGHCVLHLPSLDVVFTGDALVTLDPYTGRTGPRVVARAGTHDAGAARASLERIRRTGARIVAPGHGDICTSGAAAAARSAQESEIA